MQSLLSLLTFLTLVASSIAGELDVIQQSYLKAISKGDKQSLNSISLELADKAEILTKTLEEYHTFIEAGGTFEPLNKEHVIDNLGLTLMRLKDADGRIGYDPIITILIDEKWLIVPWADTSDIVRFQKSLTHQELKNYVALNDWANKTIALIEENTSSEQ